MYTLKFKQDYKIKIYNPSKKDWEETDIGGLYLSYVPSLTLLKGQKGPGTDKLEDAHFFHTKVDAISNWYANNCDLVEVELTLKK